jgi:hypothetical protein
MADEKPNRDRKDESNEEYERFEETLKKLVNVPKEEVDEKRREWERERGKQAG